jgi:glycosyltransferase involved in cell wall biosynthesis
MSVNPLVSVVIPAYNAERFIRQTLDSVLAQTYQNLEVIVVDDGSTDRTRECVLSYRDRVTYLYEENSGGCSKPRNEGIRAASGALLAFIDADDVMAPHRIAREVEFLIEHPEAALVFTNYQDFTGDVMAAENHFDTCPLLSDLLRNAPQGDLILDSDVSTEMFLTENFGSASPMVRREAIDSVGAFDESLKPGEDFDFQFRVASAYKIGVISRVAWHKRQHPDNMSSNVPNILHFKIVGRKRILEQETVGRRRRKLKKMLGSYDLSLAYYYTGRQNGLALRHVLSSLRFTPLRSPKHLLRILLDVLGRDTNRVRVSRLGPALGGSDETS